MLNQDVLSRIYVLYGIEPKYGVPFPQFVKDFGQLEIPTYQQRNPDIAALVIQLEAKYKSNAQQPKLK